MSAALVLADLTLACLTGADLTSARWPDDAPVPEGWKRDSSGRLRAEGADPESAEAPEPHG